MSAPYIFFTTRQVGVTFSLRSPDGPAVVGIDVTLDFLSNVLGASKATPSSLLVIVDEAGHVLANSEGKQPSVVDTNGAPVLPKVADLKRPVLEQIAGRAYAAQAMINAFDVGETRWQTFYAPLINGAEPISLAIATPQREILAEADRMRGWMLLIGLVALTIALFGVSATDGPLQVALLVSAAFASLIAFKNGYTVAAVADAAVGGVTSAVGAIFILLAVGALIGTWNMAGTIPTVVDIGIRLLSPTWFYLATTIICALVGMVTGSSWTTAGTLGVAFVGIATVMARSTAAAAGASSSARQARRGPRSPTR